MSVDVEPNLRPPDLGNPKRYVRVDRVPIIDVHRRRVRKKDREGNDVIVEEEVDERQLHRICRNSADRSERGEHGIVFLGHTDDDGPETSQPPVVGYMAGYRVGEHNGSPTIIADLYIDREDDPSVILKQYPRRSAEVIGINSEDGFIDSVALIKRAPERELGLVTSYHRKHRKVYRYACPACEKETRSMPMPDSTATFKKALELVKHLGEEIVMRAGGSLDHHGDEHGHDEHGHHDEPSDSSDDSSEHFDEPSYDEPSEEPSMMDDDSSMDDVSDDGFDEPSRMQSRRHTSRRGHVKDPSDSRQVKELVDASDDEPSEDMPTDQEPMAKRSSNTKPKEPMQPKESHREGRLDPGGHMKGSKLSHKKGKSDRYAVNAGMPSPSTNVPAMGSHSVKSSKPKTITIPPGNAKMVSRSRDDREVSRMRQDQERTQVSRYQREIDDLKATVSRLVTANEESEKKVRLSAIERRVIQLESEGYQLDRAKEVTRLSRLHSKHVDEEIENIRSNYRRSPVGQPMIPPSLFADVGGNTLAPPVEANPRAFYDRETYNAAAGNSAIGGPGKVFGAEIARLERPRPKSKDEGDYDDGSPIDRALSVVSRFQSSKTKRNN